MNEEYDLIKSPLCQSITRDGKTVKVKIYKVQEEDWSLEVVDEFNNSTVWDDLFKSDTNAFKEVLDTLEKEGIEALIGNSTGVAPAHRRC